VLAELVVKVNAVRPLVEIADKVIGVALKATGEAGANVMVCVA